MLLSLGRARPWIAGLLVALLFLSGCAGPSGLDTHASPTAARDFASPARFSDGTGAIEGTVTDTQLNPIAGAEVALSILALVTTTDELGSFTFSRLEPGNVLVSTAKAGFQSATQRVSVIAGQKTEVRFLLSNLPADEPHVVISHATGVVACDATVRWRTPVAANNQSLLVCAVTPADKSMLRYDWLLNASTGVWLETTWQSTQALGRGMRVDWGFSGGGLYQNYATGESPIRRRVPLERFLTADGQPNCKPSPSTPDRVGQCTLFNRHLVEANNLPFAPADVGVLYQQRFDEYVSSFYNGPLPEQFTALPEG
jgi:hypothetical protein